MCKLVFGASVAAGAGAASSWAQEFTDNEGEFADWDNIFARNAEVRSQNKQPQRAHWLEVCAPF
jgi:hypothetical protein